LVELALSLKLSNDSDKYGFGLASSGHGVFYPLMVIVLSPPFPPILCFFILASIYF
jgi:hypothetical protein